MDQVVFFRSLRIYISAAWRTRSHKMTMSSTRSSHRSHSFADGHILSLSQGVIVHAEGGNGVVDPRVRGSDVYVTG